MSDRGHAAVELAMAVAVLLLPVGLVVTAFGPWSEHKVFAEAIAAESARAVAIDLDHSSGFELVEAAITRLGLDDGSLRLGWCDAEPVEMSTAGRGCPLVRGSDVVVEIAVWTPLFSTPWGNVGGLWVTARHSEPIDLYRSWE